MAEDGEFAFPRKVFPSFNPKTETAPSYQTNWLYNTREQMADPFVHWAECNSQVALDKINLSQMATKPDGSKYKRSESAEQNAAG